MTKPRQVTTKGASDLLGISVRQVARRVEAGTLTPSFKFPGATGGYLFDRDYIEELAAQKQPAALAGATGSKDKEI